MTKNYGYRPSKVVIDLQAIKKNVQSLKEYLNEETKIIAVVKADGYGHGISQVASAALEAGASMVSVATPDEAIDLRESGIQGDILVMGPSPVSFAKIAAEQDISLMVASSEWLEELSEMIENIDGNIKMHVKIDSGMGRIGVRKSEELQKVIQLIEQHEQFQLEGAFTHFPCADDGVAETTEGQRSLFESFVEQFPTKPNMVHVANSATTLLYPAFQADAVRFGISLYGIAPSDYVQTVLPFPLERAMSIETEIAFVKRVEKGHSISYGATYSTADDEWIATLPIGYADGLKRGLRGQEVLIEGERMPLVGTICMDQCMVKLPRKIPVGTKVVLIGQQGNDEITVEEWAEKLQTIPYEIVVSISKRIPRVYQD